MKNLIYSAIIIFIIIAAVVGEVKCVIKFFNSDFEPSYRRECIYGFSAIIGIGAIVGYMDFEDVKPLTP